MDERVTMLAQQEQVVLKLFSGPQVGAEAALPPGEYLIGRDLTCDIVIDDILVEAQHCRLFVTDDTVELEAIDGPVYVEGQPFTGGTVDLFDYIMIGGSCFALGTNKSQWPARPLPEIRRDPVSAKLPSDTTAEPDFSPIGSPPQATAVRNAGGQVIPTEVPQRRNVQMLAAWCGLFTASAIIIALVLTAANIGFSDEVSEMAQVTTPMEERLWEIARSQSFESDIRIEKGNNANWKVIGYLDTRQHRLKLTDDLRKIIAPASIKLWDSETLAESAQGVLSSLHVPLAAKPGKAGTVIVSGAIKNIEQWTSARERILRDISAIRELDDQSVSVLSPKNGNLALRQVGVERTTEPIVPTKGQAVAAAANNAEASNRTEPNSTAEPITILKNVYVLPSDVEAPPRPQPAIRSVSVGACRSLITTDGTRVMKGGRLDGWMVMDIEDDKIVLERGPFRHIVDLLAP